MILIRSLAMAGMVLLTSAGTGSSERPQEQPSISFGMAQISLGMTVQEVEQRLSEGARHIQFLSDKKTAIVHLNGEPDRTEGQVTFSGGRAIYAQFQMPDVQSADELAEEIAGAVDSMAVKNCNISNYSSHGTGGGFSQSIFDCGTRTFNIMTTHILGSNGSSINVNIEIGHT
jgi:hypothetical protein